MRMNMASCIDHNIIVDICERVDNHILRQTGTGMNKREITDFCHGIKVKRLILATATNSLVKTDESRGTLMPVGDAGKLGIEQS